MNFPQVLGATEIAELLDVTRQRVQQLAQEPEFPAPVAELKMGKIWLEADIVAWAARAGRTLARD